MPPATSPLTRAPKTTGLRYWMLQVLEQCEHVSADFGPDPVHDLRVALRRCRSLADGLMALDADPDWKAMKKAGKRLFQRLGALRDVHVMMEWIEKLNPEEVRVDPASRPVLPQGDESASLVSDQQDAGNSAAKTLLEILRRREHEEQHEAQAALEEFDRKQWRQWSKSLPARATRFRPGSALFKHLALERWTEARELHNLALRNRSQSAFHSLRIGIKRLRYIVENFLPVEHRAWSNDLKKLQDLLGEVHDLDVLWATAVSCKVLPDAASRTVWHKRILAERTIRIDSYRSKMIGPESLWNVWRTSLPQGKQIQALASRRMKLWANRLDPDFPHSERVAALALQLYDGLLSSGWAPSVDGVSARSSLLTAALLHDIGKSKGQKGHHKTSSDLIKAHGNPLGWKPADLQRAAIVARFHRGALPTRHHKALRDLLPDEQKCAIQLIAILRLANAMDSAHDGQIHRIRIENVRAEKGANRNGVTPSLRSRPRARLVGNEALVIAAEGYMASSATARTIAAERHLLETVLRRPVVVKPMKVHSHLAGNAPT